MTGVANRRPQFSNQVRLVSLQIAVLILSLLTSTTQCLMRCAKSSCDSSSRLQASRTDASLPPCHQQKSPKDPASPSEPCKLPLLLAEDRSPALVKSQLAPVDATIALTDFAVYNLAVPWREQPRLTEQDPAPHWPALLRTTVLRI